jgi:hypothetical protein
MTARSLCATGVRRHIIAAGALTRLGATAIRRANLSD